MKKMVCFVITIISICLITSCNKLVKIESLSYIIENDILKNGTVFLYESKTNNISFEIEPLDATLLDFEIRVEDENVVKINKIESTKIVIMGLKEGDTNIMVKAKKGNVNKTIPVKVKKNINNNYYSLGLNQLDLVFKDFRYSEKSYSFKTYNPQDSSQGSTYSGSAALWGYGAILTAVSEAAIIDPYNSTTKERSLGIVEGLEAYRMPRDKRYYTSNQFYGGEPYYDDNAWIVLGLLYLGKAYNNEEYYQMSREILDYVLSGESPDGGIYWKESVVSRNVCSTGPGIVGALLHYQHKKQDVLLNTAKRLYEWCKKTLMDPVDKVYWDNIYPDENGVEKIYTTKWTYNSGTMIWAATLLYEITGEDKYLDDAKNTALGALSYFYTKNKDGRYYYPASPWFNLYLLRGYYELARVVGDGSYDYLVKTFKSNMDIAIVTSIVSPYGYIHPNWGGGLSDKSDTFFDVLDIAATSEVLMLIGDFQINLEK